MLIIVEIIIIIMGIMGIIDDHEQKIHSSVVGVDADKLDTCVCGKKHTQLMSTLCINIRP